jgi:hypothetical protein
VCAEANAKEADKVTEQLQSTGISSDGATPSGITLLLFLIWTKFLFLISYLCDKLVFYVILYPKDML